MSSTINDPELRAELTACYWTYEQALVTNDIETMTALFWDSEWVVRFGATENLYGTDEIAAFRQHRPTVNLEREILKMQVVTFGDDTGAVTVEFRRAGRLGRQSQFWRKFAQGWRVVSAHVSYLPDH